MFSSTTTAQGKVKVDEKAEELNQFVPTAHLNWKELESRKEEMQENIESRQLAGFLSFGHIDEALELHKRHQQRVRQQQELQKQRNEVAKKLAETGRSQAEKAQLKEQGKSLKEQVLALEAEQKEAEQQLRVVAAEIPNWSDAAVRHLREERVVGYIAPELAQRVKSMDPQVHSHMEIGKRLDLFMWPEAARMSGTRFAVLKRGAALLELALVQWALHTLTHQHQFVPLLPPDLVRPRFAASCGFQPRGQHSQTYLLAEHDLCLAATSEIAIAALNSERLLSQQELPIRMAAFSHCFRAEAGTHGAEEKGLFRLHQFSKVEMFAVTDEQSSEKTHLEFVEIQKSFISQLGLHARIIDMPPFELGASASRKFDIEAYFPSRQGYREVTSASNCTAYQSRRLQLRYDDFDQQRKFAHTVNATAIAIPRVIMCILETHLQPDGSVKIPAPLVPFMGGLTSLQPPDRKSVV